MSNSTRDAIRSATMGQAQKLRSRRFEYHPPIFGEQEVTGSDGRTYTETVITGYGDPVTVEVRQPSLVQRNKLVKGAGDDQMRLVALLTISQVYVPGTNERVFEETDYDSLLETPAGGFVDQFAEVAMELMNLNVEEQRKNSPTTQ